MTAIDAFQLVLFVGILLTTAKPLALYMEKVFQGERTWMHPVLGWLERLIYRLCGIDPLEDQPWTRYASRLLVFSATGCFFTYSILRLQRHLPLNPQKLGPVAPALAFDTAMSFTTNTDWQFYAGEATMSYFSQMVALVFHNFVSAAVGIAVAVALVRALVRRESKGIGNFWADNEIALNILLAGLTIVFLFAVVTLKPFALYAGTPVSMVILISLLVCLIPTTLGGLLSAIGIAGMDRLVQRNVLAMSGRAVETAGDVDVLLLDKTGTITIGNRMATEFITAEGVSQEELASNAFVSSAADLTPEGRSIVLLANQKGRRQLKHESARYIPFSAETRMSGIDYQLGSVRKGAKDAIEHWIRSKGGKLDSKTLAIVDQIASTGGTPLVVAKDDKALGVIHLKDIVKPGISDRFQRIRAMGIKTVMITGDNRLTAAAIAQQAGVDDFLAEAKPEDKLRLIKTIQAEGRMVAMSGDGTNDAPALAQSDVGLVMNTATQPAREAGNMIDLDSDPTKIIEIVEIGKELLITRGSLTTFSIANDVAKYFAIIPAIFASKFPGLAALNIMHLASPKSAVLSAVIFNALIIIALIPLALRGVGYRPQSASSMMRRNILVYGIGGMIVPFIGIKAIDILITLFQLA